MKSVTFISSNAAKAAYLTKYLGIEIAHRSLDRSDEIQSLDLYPIVSHKAAEAYAAMQSPVLVEDISLEFHAFGRLPGPFIKWYLQEMKMETICSLLDGRDRSATAKCLFGFYDGVKLVTFEGALEGSIAQKPRGSKGFGGWDPIFIPEGYSITRAEMDEENDRLTYLKLKPLAQLKTFLEAYIHS